MANRSNLAQIILAICAIITLVFTAINYFENKELRKMEELKLFALENKNSSKDKIENEKEYEIDYEFFLFDTIDIDLVLQNYWINLILKDDITRGQISDNTKESINLGYGPIYKLKDINGKIFYGDFYRRIGHKVREKEISPAENFNGFFDEKYEFEVEYDMILPYNPSKMVYGEAKDIYLKLVATVLVDYNCEWNQNRNNGKKFMDNMKQKQVPIEAKKDICIYLNEIEIDSTNYINEFIFPVSSKKNILFIEFEHLEYE